MSDTATVLNRQACEPHMSAAFGVYGSDTIGPGESAPESEYYGLYFIQGGTLTALVADKATGLDQWLTPVEHPAGAFLSGIGVITVVTSGTAIVQCVRNKPLAD